MRLLLGRSGALFFMGCVLAEWLLIARQHWWFHHDGDLPVWKGMWRLPQQQDARNLKTRSTYSTNPIETTSDSSATTSTTVLSDSKPGKPFIVLVRAKDAVTSSEEKGKRNHTSLISLSHCVFFEPFIHEQHNPQLDSIMGRPRRGPLPCKMNCLFGKIKYWNWTMCCMAVPITYLARSWDDWNCNSTLWI